MKYTITFFLILVLAFNAFAENDDNSKNADAKNPTTIVTGKVIDNQTGETLTGVNINVPELGIDTYTDFKGQFKFTVEKNRNYTLKASFISYEDKTLSSDKLSDKQSIEVPLSEIDH